MSDLLNSGGFWLIAVFALVGIVKGVRRNRGSAEERTARRVERSEAAQRRRQESQERWAAVKDAQREKRAKAEAEREARRAGQPRGLAANFAKGYRDGAAKQRAR